MVNIKIDVVDNGYVVSYVLPPVTSSLTGEPLSGPVQVVTIHKEFKEVTASLEKAFGKI